MNNSFSDEIIFAFYGAVQSQLEIEPNRTMNASNS